MSSMPSARRGAHQAGSRTWVRRQDRHRPARAQPRGPAVPQPDHPLGAVAPGGQPSRAARRARQRPGGQVPGRPGGIQAQQYGSKIFPVTVISVMYLASAAPGTLVLQHALPPPARQPRPPAPPQTGTMTTGQHARHGDDQPRSALGTLMATVTPSTSTYPPPGIMDTVRWRDPAPQGHPQRRGTLPDLGHTKWGEVRKWRRSGCSMTCSSAPPRCTSRSRLPLPPPWPAILAIEEADAWRQAAGTAMTS